MKPNPSSFLEKQHGRRKNNLRRVLAVALAITAAVVAGALWAAWRHKPPARRAAASLPQNVARRLSGYTFTRSENGHPIFTIHAARTLAYRRGSTMELEDVHAVIFGRSGKRHDEMQAARCRYDNLTGALFCSGKASFKLRTSASRAAPSEARSQPPLVLYTSDVTYNPRGSIVQTSQGVQFQYGADSGRALGLDYNTKAGWLNLRRNVNLDVQSRSKTSPPILIDAGGLFYSRRSSQIALRAPVSVREGDRSITASTGFIGLDGRNRPSRIVLAGRVSGFAPLTSGNFHANAERVDARLDPRTSQLQRIVATGSVDLEVNARAYERRLSAQSVRLDLAGPKMRPTAGIARGDVRLVYAPGPANEKSARGAGPEKRILSASGLEFRFQVQGKLREAHTIGPGTISLVPTSAVEDRRTITAGQLLMSFNPEGLLDKLHGVSGSRILDTPGARAPRGALPWQSSSEALEATLNPATGAVEALNQTDKFEFQQGDRRATADAAVYRNSRSSLTLVGHPLIWNSDSRIRAAHIAIELADSEATGWGGVQSFHYEDSQPGSPPSGAVALPPPLTVLADQVILRKASQWVQYQGHVRAWRGANVVECASLDVYRKQQRVSSGFEVVTSLIQPASEQSPMPRPVGENHQPTPRPQPLSLGERVANPFALPLATALSAAKGLRVNSASRVRGLGRDFSTQRSKKVKPGAAQPIVIRADRLVYFNLGRKAVYRGHVVVQTENTTLQASRLTAYFSKSAPRADPMLTRAVATGNVRVQQVPGRRAQGQRAEYFARTGKIVLTGGSPMIYDPVQGYLTAQRLTFFTRDASLFADGGKKAPTLSMRRVRQQ